MDLGRKTGYALWTRGSGISSVGTWETITEKQVKGRASEFRRFDPRPKILWKLLTSVLDQCPGPKMIVFEDVEFQSYTLQTQQWAGYRTAAWLVPGVKYFDCVPVGTLKQFATGHGGATKEMMKDAFCNLTLPAKLAGSALDDNAIDAFFILSWTLSKYGL